MNSVQLFRKDVAVIQGEAPEQAQESEVGHGWHASESHTFYVGEVLHGRHVSLIGLSY